MRTRVILLLTVLSALGAATSTAARPGASPTPDAPPRPVLVIPEKIKDFGVVTRGTVLKARFLVHNAGNAPLGLTYGSRQSSPIKVLVPAGGHTTIEFEVSTADFSGPMSKAVIIYSNDPDTPQVNLVIKFESRAFIEVLPRPLLRFTVLQGEAATQKVVLTSFDGSEFKVTGAETGSAPYKIEFRELGEKERLPDRQGSQWEVSVTVPADSRAGLFTEKVTVKTSSAKAPDVLISVYASIQPMVQIVPEQLNFGTVPGDAPVGRPVILVNNRQGSQLEITKVEVDNPNFTAESTPIQAGQRWQVVVNLKPGATRGEHRGTLSITTNDPVFALITVPVRAVVQ
ncbi:MAG: hypothetical protein HY825_14465 [Acidobacteria bacterium]|nr:hypothetical protein [Acidobacteriota bacterium]